MLNNYEQTHKGVIIALDYPNEAQVFNFLDKFDCTPYVKVGLELFCACGQEIVRKLKARGHKVFLDCKLHDIPNTVASSVAVLSSLGVDLLNVHCAGGATMMSAAATAAGNITLIGVTQLTSISPQMLNDELLIATPLQQTVLHYATLAASSGLKGVVCSAHEAPLIKQALGSGFITVTPGIRLNADNNDQQRVATPEDATASDYLVVGRPITRAANPLNAYREVCSRFGLA